MTKTEMDAYERRTRQIEHERKFGKPLTKTMPREHWVSHKDGWTVFDCDTGEILYTYKS